MTLYLEQNLDEINKQYLVNTNIFQNVLYMNMSELSPKSQTSVIENKLTRQLHSLKS